MKDWIKKLLFVTAGIIILSTQVMLYYTQQQLNYQHELEEKRSKLQLNLWIQHYKYHQLREEIYKKHHIEM